MARTYTAVQMGRLLHANESTVRTWGKRFPEFVPTLGAEGAPPYPEDAIPVLTFIRDRYAEGWNTDMVRDALGQHFPHIAEPEEAGSTALAPLAPAPLVDEDALRDVLTPWLDERLNAAVSPLLEEIQALRQALAEQAASERRQAEQERKRQEEAQAADERRRIAAEEARKQAEQRAAERDRRLMDELASVRRRMDERMQAEHVARRSWLDRLRRRNKPD